MTRLERISVIAALIASGLLLVVALAVKCDWSPAEFTVCERGCDMTPAHFGALLGQHSPGEQIVLRKECAVNEDMDGLVCDRAEYQFTEAGQ